MGRPPTPLHWPALRPETEADRLQDQLAAQWQALGSTLGRTVADLYARLDALEGRLQQQAIEAEWMTPKAAALQHGYTADAISRMARQGRIRAHGRGAGLRVCVADIEALARHRAGGK